MNGMKSFQLHMDPFISSQKVPSKDVQILTAANKFSKLRSHPRIEKGVIPRKNDRI